MLRKTLSRALYGLLVALISPFAKERALARNLVAPGQFFEVFVDTPIKIAELRDPKGLYALARQGKLSDFTGISSVYETPFSPEIHLDTVTISPKQSAGVVMDYFKSGANLFKR